WSYVTYLACSTVLLGACPPPTATTGTDSEAAATNDQTQGPGTTDECPIGDAGCPCTQGGACNEGLVCDADHRCVPDGPTTTDEPMVTTGTTEEPSTSSIDPSTTDEPLVPCRPSDGQ